MEAKVLPLVVLPTVVTEVVQFHAGQDIMLAV
eukprot:CAMPEP_0170154722 /NCGR_PEP_ID=MMETSP0033_2-20121228/58683_1 /TAXON_ID=195969 /ORGANISM="Dolichomastix tenuilepis, Strain CCMP3274" /LENGTH=31 /DNA_ID= /DNA_START= /DNA_END= /DNA_ORIENTATION=